MEDRRRCGEVLGGGGRAALRMAHTGSRARTHLSFRLWPPMERAWRRWEAELQRASVGGRSRGAGRWGTLLWRTVAAEQDGFSSKAGFTGISSMRFQGAL